jgi:hypothetical protein
MNATTNPRSPRPSPARWSKLAASTLSAGALLAIVTGLTAAAQERPATPSTGAGSGRVLPAAGTSQPTGQAPVTAVPAPVPAAVPAPSAPTLPHGVSKASGR